MDKQTDARFREAVERKNQAAEQRSRAEDRTGEVPPGETPGDIGGDQHSIVSDSRSTQDVYSVRDKNSGKGKKTADKWNQ